MGGALIDHLWQSTLFCAAVWSITLMLRSNPASVRHWLWLAASLKFLVPFSVLHWLGAAAGLPTPEESQPVFFGATVAAATPMVTPAAVLGASQSVGATFLLPALFGLWMLGSAWCGLTWLRGWRTATLISGAAQPAPGALPGTFVTDADIEPSVVGVLRPVVLLPSALPGRLTGQQLDAVLAHEFEHIARHDNLKAHAHRLVETLFWFHPLVWYIGRQLDEERERACDEAVLARGFDRGEYAAGILAVCRHCAAVHSPHAVAALAGDLTRRIGHILGGAAPLALGFVKAFALSVATYLLVVAPLVAGAIDDTLRRQAQVRSNALALRDAHVQVSAPAGTGGGPRISVSGSEIAIHDSSLRQLIALTFDVEEHEISGGGGLLDAARYDIRASVPSGVREPEDFDPAALRGMVTKLLATQFNLELHVNRLCQHPCGPRALEATDTARP